MRVLQPEATLAHVRACLEDSRTQGSPSALPGASAAEWRGMVEPSHSDWPDDLPSEFQFQAEVKVPGGDTDPNADSDAADGAGSERIMVPARMELL